jgi:hypothetical protein
LELLTVQTVADLKGCSDRYIRKLAQQGKIARQVQKSANGSAQYLIPLSELDLPLQRKWYKHHAGAVPPGLQLASGGGEKPAVRASPAKSLEDYTAAQRDQIGEWIRLLDDWQKFRAAFEGPLSGADGAYIDSRRIDISVKTLYRRWKSYKDGDLDGLVEKRGRHRKGCSGIDPLVWSVFLSYYLDRAGYSSADCYAYTKKWLQIKGRADLLATLQGYNAFYRNALSDVPDGVATFHRKGEKALHDRCAPYIRRLYDKMLSNDYWVADNHTFDVFTLGPNGKPHRLHITAIIDARSTAMLGWCVTPTPCAEATLYALRRAIMPPGGRPANGMPLNFYVDNGSEFLVHDVGGRGHRKRKSRQEEFEPPPVLRRLGIEMVNAIPGNPEAKIIERVFLDLKDDFSRAMESFSGGSPQTRPEGLDKLLKSGKILTDKEFTALVDEWIEGYYNHLPYGGSVVSDRGKTKIQVYNEHLDRIRLPKSERDLNLMMMRSSRMVSVGRLGVKLNIAGYVINYWTPEFLAEWGRKKVYFRYDPDDLSSVRVYNEENKFVCELPADDVAVMEYGADKETIKGGMRKVGKYNKIVREWKNGRVLDINDKISVLTLISMTAKENLENPPEYMRRDVNVIELIQASEDAYSYPMAVGGDAYDLSGMIEAVKQRQKEDAEE